MEDYNPLKNRKSRIEMDKTIEQQIQDPYGLKKFQEQERDSFLAFVESLNGLKRLQERERESLRELLNNTSVGYLLIKQLQDQKEELLKSTLLAYPAFLDDQYLIDAITENKNFYETFLKSIEEIKSLLELPVEESSLKQKLNMLLFANVITAMETYLSDALINTVINSTDLLKKAIKNIEGLKDKKFKLDEIMDCILNDGHKSAKEYFFNIINNTLLNIVYHKLSKVSGIYRQVLDIEFPEDTKQLEPYIIHRHHIIHRNGKDKEGNPLEITDNDILNLIELVEILINNINEQINALSNLSEETRYPLRGSVIRYEEPTEPVAMEDWDVLK